MQISNYFWNALFVVVIAAFTTNSAISQQVTVCGIVKTFNKYPLEGVKVEARKSDQIATTDSLGHFCIKCREKRDKLVIKAKGFYPERVRVKDQDSVTVNMLFKGGEENKQIATGLGYIDEEDLTIAISTGDSESINYGSYGSIYELLDNEFSEIQVSGRRVSIRNMGQPLFVVDGSYLDNISHIKPLNVKSINVLKGAGASMYGSRGTNGVIVIETKSQ